MTSSDVLKVVPVPFLKFIYLFIYLAVLGLGCGMLSHSCSMCDLVPQPGIELKTPAMGAWNLSHWTTREVPPVLFDDNHKCKSCSLYIGKHHLLNLSFGVL